MTGCGVLVPEFILQGPRNPPVLPAAAHPASYKPIQLSASGGRYVPSLSRRPWTPSHRDPVSIALGFELGKAGKFQEHLGDGGLRLVCLPERLLTSLDGQSRIYIESWYIDGSNRSWFALSDNGTVLS